MELKKYYTKVMHKALDSILNNYAFIEILEYIDNGNSYDLLDFIYNNGFYTEREKEVRCLMFNESRSFLLSLISTHTHFLDLLYRILDFYIEKNNHKKVCEIVNLIKEINGVDWMIM